MTDDITPTAEDLARDLRAELVRADRTGFASCPGDMRSWVLGLAVSAVRRALAAEAEVARLRDLLNIDRSGMAHALVEVQRIVGGWAWLPQGEWGSYEYDEQTEAALRAEVGTLIDAVVETATAALRASGDNAIAAFRPDTIRSLQGERERLRATLAALLAAVDHEDVMIDGGITSGLWEAVKAARGVLEGKPPA